jgi:hypothetical protein
MKKILSIFLLFFLSTSFLFSQYIIYNNIEDEKDVSNEILQTLYYLTATFRENVITKDVYVDKIEKGIVYLDDTKYTLQEKDIIERAIKAYVSYVINPRDEVVNELAFNSGIDSDWKLPPIDSEKNEKDSSNTKKIKLNQEEQKLIDEMFGGSNLSMEEEAIINKRIAQEELKKQQENNKWYSENIFIEWLTAYSFLNYERTVRVNFKKSGETVNVYVNDLLSGRIDNCQLDGYSDKNYIDFLWMGGKRDRNIRVYSNSEVVSEENRGTISGIKNIENGSLLKREGLDW